MTVFKTVWKILNKNKITVILFTIMLLLFGVSNMRTSEKSMNFIATKPDVLIVNYDKDEGITKDFIKYITDNSNIVDIKTDEEKINDALFYRDVNYVIYIPENYSKDFMEGKNVELEIKSTGDYQASLEEMLVSRYIKVAKIYQKNITNEDELVRKINETLSEQVQTEIISKLDTNAISNATFYYNFASYSILACLLLVISLILSSFNDQKIKKRIIVSSTKYKKHNKILLISNCCYSFILWFLYVVISFFILGDVMTKIQGIIYIINSLVLTICATTIAFFIGNLVSSKGAINGIVNVVALGSSFICGVFVPMRWLPDSVLKMAHLLPTYYYVSTNEALKTIEQFNIQTLKPLIINMAIILCFALLFIILTNIISRKKRTF
jgi:ABC-2 type transport system permease protein